MKDYKEVTSEILKRRDAHVAYIKKLKKRTIVLLAVFTVCLSVGGGAWMIGAGSRNVPDVPPVTETDTAAGSSETMAESTVQTETLAADTTDTEPVDTEKIETIETEPLWTEPLWTEHYETEPVWTDYYETEPTVIYTEPIVTEPVRIEQTEPVETEPVVTESAEADTSDGNFGEVAASPSGGVGDDTENTKTKYKGSHYDYVEYTYYDGTTVFYDGETDLPDRILKYGFDTPGYADNTWKTRFDDYLATLYGDNFNPNFIGDTYETRDQNDVYVLKYNRSNNMIEISFNISDIDAYFAMDINGMVEYVKTLKYFTAAVEHLGIETPYYVLEKWERENQYSYSFTVYERDEYFNLSERTHEKGNVYVNMRFDNYDGSERDRVTLNIWIREPYEVYVMDESDRLSYAEAVEYVLSLYDYEDEFEYVKNNLKCVIRNNLDINHRESTVLYDFCVEYTNENGSKYYKHLSAVSMFDEKTE